MNSKNVKNLKLLKNSLTFCYILPKLTILVTVARQKIFKFSTKTINFITKSSKFGESHVLFCHKACYAYVLMTPDDSIRGKIGCIFSVC